MEELFGGRPTFSALSSPFQTPSTGSNVSPRENLSEQVRQEQKRLGQSRQQETRERTDLSVIRTNRQMCEFWTGEFKKDGAEEGQKYREAVCLRYRASVN